MVPKRAPLASDRLLMWCQQAPCPQRQAHALRDRLQGKQCTLLASCSAGTAPGGCSTDLTFFFRLSHFENTKYSSYVSGPQSQGLLPGTDEFGDVDAGNFRKRWSYWLLANFESSVRVFAFCNHRRGMQFVMNTFKCMTGGCLSETYMFSKSLYLKDLSLGRDSAYGS